MTVAAIVAVVAAVLAVAALVASYLVLRGVREHDQQLERALAKGRAEFDATVERVCGNTEREEERGERGEQSVTVKRGGESSADRDI